MTQSPPPWPAPPCHHPSIDLLGLGTTLGQMLASPAKTHEAHALSIAVLEEIRDDIRTLPMDLAQRLDQRRRTRSLFTRAKRMWPVLSGMAYILAIASGKLGLWEGLMKIVALG